MDHDVHDVLEIVSVKTFQQWLLEAKYLGGNSIVCLAPTASRIYLPLSAKDFPDCSVQYRKPRCRFKGAAPR